MSRIANDRARELRRPGQGGRPSLRERLAGRVLTAIHYTVLVVGCIAGGALIELFLTHHWS